MVLDAADVKIGVVVYWIMIGFAMTIVIATRKLILEIIWISYVN